MVFPKLPLLRSTMGCFGGFLRMRMDILDGKITKRQLDLVGIACQHLIEDIENTLAIGALKIGKLHDGDRGIFRTFEGSALGTDLDDRWPQVNLHLSFVAQTPEINTPGLGQLVLLKIVEDLWSNFIQGLADARLIGGIKIFDLFVVTSPTLESTSCCKS